MDNKQTAVEWLIDELQNHHVAIDIKNTVAYQQAKEMEKEQIEKAIDECRHNYKHSDNYYNETYGQNLLGN